jgi:hypothetical protein
MLATAPGGSRLQSVSRQQPAARTVVQESRTVGGPSLELLEQSPALQLKQEAVTRSDRKITFAQTWTPEAGSSSKG